MVNRQKHKHVYPLQQQRSFLWLRFMRNLFLILRHGGNKTPQATGIREEQTLMLSNVCCNTITITPAETILTFYISLNRFSHSQLHGRCSKTFQRINKWESLRTEFRRSRRKLKMSSITQNDKKISTAFFQPNYKAQTFESQPRGEWLWNPSKLS